MSGGTRIAITRAVSPALSRCELTHLPRSPIDLDRACRQHEAYEAQLTALGCTVKRLPADPDLPDSVFVEDVAVVLDEVAVITRPGAASRRAEPAAVAAALRAYRPVREIAPPGTLDGGDVLVIDRDVYVGRSTRSNAAGIDQLAAVLGPLGYRVCGVAIRGCLHLKSAATRVAPRTVLANPGWVETAALGVEIIEVDPAEPAAANALLVGDTVVYPAAFARSRRRLEAAGIAVSPVDVSELQKAEGGVTCCAVIVNDVRSHS